MNGIAYGRQNCRNIAANARAIQARSKAAFAFELGNRRKNPRQCGRAQSIVVLDIGSDTHNQANWSWIFARHVSRSDSGRRVHQQGFAYRILIAKKSTRKGLVDDGDLLPVIIVAIRESAPSVDRSSNGTKIIGTDQLKPRVWNLGARAGGRPSRKADKLAPSAAKSEGKVSRVGDGLDSRNSAQPGDDLVVGLHRFGSGLVFASVERHGEGQHVMGIEARIHPQQPLQALPGQG